MQRNQHEEKTVILKITANQRMINFAIKTFSELGAIVEDCGDADRFVKDMENKSKLASVDHKAVNKGLFAVILAISFVLACLYLVFGNANASQQYYNEIKQEQIK